ncbi:MAG: ribosomal-protein-alanine N-acetyltransferase, partial [Nitrospirae bacterium]
MNPQMAEPPFTLRAMTLEDLPQVLKIERQSFSTPWSEEMFLQELKSSESLLFVAEDMGRVVGYIVTRLLGGGHSEIRVLAVRPDFRRRGVGSALLERALKALYYRGAQKVYLEVRKSNTPARKLYLKAGFIET